jgi:hypothetical protein
MVYNNPVSYYVDITPDRVYDRLPIIERYLARDVNLHIHFAAGERMHCLTFEALNSVKVIPFDAGMDSDSAIPDTRDEMPVFVRVGTVSQAPRPIASIIRLQLLGTCKVGGVDALEVTGCTASREIFCRIHNRKLRAALLDAGRKQRVRR